MQFVVLLSAVLLLSSQVSAAPLFKVFCSGTPLFRGRVDSIVYPGQVGFHAHRIFGANGFAVEETNTSPLDIYKHLRASTCTTCSIKTVDNSVYWHPELYYRWANGSLSLVPRGGLTVYYEGRGGDGAQENPDFRAFPPGFRMLAGNPYKRTYNDSLVADRAVSFACLASKGPLPQTGGFPGPHYCDDGLRMQVNFPMCWDGVNIDSPDHMSHVAYPDSRPDGGNCPPSHPVRIMSIFFEADYSMTDFPVNANGGQDLVLACGDSTGYGMHGDFLNGWDVDVLQAAVKDPSCNSTNTNNGNTVTNCKPLAPYVQSPEGGQCLLAKPIPLTEDLGSTYAINKLPGCNPITDVNGKAVPCFTPPSQSYSPGIDQRFLLKSKSNNMYVSCPLMDTLPMIANVQVPQLQEVFSPFSFNSGGVTGVSLVSELGLNWLTVQGADVVYCNARGRNAWESFKIMNQTGGYIAIQSNKNQMYLTVLSDNTIAATSSTIGAAQLFLQQSPDGGHI